jgi:hypothetical protein
MFMELRRRENPYPKFLLRAQMHGELFPRFIDDFTQDYCDTFGSDLHLFEEWHSDSEIRVSIYDVQEMLETIQNLSEEVSKHLRKTQINKGRKPTDTSYFFSPFVSLSANFRWALHRAFQKHRNATDSQQSGLAIFDTSKLLEINVQLWRVSDLLDFLDSKPRFKGTTISPLSRSWAGNADEYLCSSFIPKEALVTFVPCSQIMDPQGGSQEIFLQPSFRESTNLAVFKSSGQKPLSTDEYLLRVSRFLEDLLDHVSPSTNGDSFVEYLVDRLADYSQWGYDLTTDLRSLTRALRRLVNEEYAYGLESWLWDQSRDSRLSDCCRKLSEVYFERAERINMEESQL